MVVDSRPVVGASVAEVDVDVGSAVEAEVVVVTDAAAVVESGLRLAELVGCAFDRPDAQPAVIITIAVNAIAERTTPHGHAVGAA